MIDNDTIMFENDRRRMQSFKIFTHKILIVDD